MSTAETIVVAAHVSGTVLEIKANSGEALAAGDVLMVIECMKMHMGLEVNAGGVVRALLVKPGDLVEEGQQVALLEAVPG
ncbi:MAG: acetyl-CoA carboxylase biotin carboxyl carrier protein subunit [Gammaproteobacteria bacterium]